MPITEFELIILENGEIALRRAGTNDQLVCIRFSPAVKDYLGDHHTEVAKNMLDAGIQAMFDINEKLKSEPVDDSTDHPTVH
jgi:hypothetical protein